MEEPVLKLETQITLFVIVQLLSLENIVKTVLYFDSIFSLFIFFSF